MANKGQRGAKEKKKAKAKQPKAKMTDYKKAQLGTPPSVVSLPKAS